MDTERDMENFVRDYGTGNAIYDPPQFVNYASPDAVPPASQLKRAGTTNLRGVLATLPIGFPMDRVVGQAMMAQSPRVAK